MERQIIENAIQSFADASKWSNNESTRKAYVEGERMLLDFLLHNPHLLESSKENEFVKMCLFPSVINFSDGD